MFHKILSITGLLMALFSIFLCSAAMYDLIHPESTDTKTGVLIGLFIFFFITTASGIYLFISGKRKYLRYHSEKAERELLAFISEKGGRVTPHEVALNTRMTVEEARENLDRMCEDGSGELQLTPEGKKIYVFFGFLSEKEKSTAKNVLEF